MMKIFLLSLYVLQMGSAQKFFRILVLTDEDQNHVLGTIGAALKAAEETYPGFRFDQVHVASVEESEEDASRKMLREVEAGAGAVLDLTSAGRTAARTASRGCRLPYLRVDTAHTAHAAVAAYLDRRRASNAVFISRDHAGLEGIVRFFIGKYNVRVGIINGLERNVANSLLQLSPIPEYFVLYGSTGDLATLHEQAEGTKLTELAERWLLVFEDFDHGSFNRSLRRGTAVMTADKDVCCRLAGKAAGCRCDNDTQTTQEFLRHVVLLLARLANHLDELGTVATPHPENCTSQADVEDEDRDASREHVTQALKEMADDGGVVSFDLQDDVVYLRSDLHIWTVGNTHWLPWGRYRDNQLVTDPGTISQPTRRFFRVGVVESIPWSYKRRGLAAGDMSRPRWEGYCIDLLQELADGLSFDYELVEPQGGGLGVRRPDGSWDGVVGDMVAGKTDIIVAPLAATSEREEVLDFVTPYFYKSGISIVIRKPVHKASLFKFMTAMKLEVWMSILASLTLTAVMIWLLEKLSPYSYRNNKRMYQHPCREFTLAESFWFAMTSITPQGGGEAPKALSGRTLVAAYWLFVVLMLATFTANLATFLTVERMETPVSSLEQLGRQSRISYTVVNNSDTHEYFRNMKNFEDILHDVWKNLALNASSNPSQYRVWDYPIKEQYENILLAITETGPVDNETVGFQKVLDDEESKFAFIHDSSRIQYEVTVNCYLAEVGEVFAEREYAIGVQQGSRLIYEIGKKLLHLQKMFTSRDFLKNIGTQLRKTLFQQRSK